MFKQQWNAIMIPGSPWFIEFVEEKVFPAIGDAVLVEIIVRETRRGKVELIAHGYIKCGVSAYLMLGNLCVARVAV